MARLSKLFHMHRTTGKATYLAVSHILGIQVGYISPFHSLTSQVAKSLNVVPQKILQGGDIQSNEH